jgi:hypothetical protein
VGQESEDFSTWAAHLDFGYDAWRKKTAADLETWVARNNARGWDRVFHGLRDRCQAPGCRYPLRDAESYHLIGVGNVCNLCHYMYMIVHSKAFFVAAQQQDDEAKRKGNRDDRFNR